MFLLFFFRSYDLKKQRSNYYLLFQSILSDVKLVLLTRSARCIKVET